MNKIRTIIRKEWAEVFRNKMVVSVIIFLPLLFTAMMLAFLYFTTTSSSSADALAMELPEQFAALCGEGEELADCVTSYIMTQFLVMYIFVPLIIPINIAAYSVVGEKTHKSLEPLLATPISTMELLLGKMLAAVIPAVLATWGGFLIFVAGTVIITGGFSLIGTLLNVGWLAAILVLGPLLSVLSVCFCLMVSSRVNDPRVAEQISSVIILPVMVLLFGQIIGFLVFSSALAWLLSLVALILDAIMMFLCVQLFARESILTRWK
ncbi:MAG: ABC transporter permease subunit [Anaerolineae bacterium]|nr:ABC transporter permease subunit [Anaerolineae bacterium]